MATDYVRSTNERWTRAENAQLRLACEAQRARALDCDPAFWQQLIAEGLFPGRSWRALQRRAWARKWYRPRYLKRGQGRKARAAASTPAQAAAARPVDDAFQHAAERAAIQMRRTPEQGTLPLPDPLPRVVGGMLAVETTAPDGTVGPLAVPLDGLIVGFDTATQKATLRTASGTTIPTTHGFDQVMRAIERAKVAR